MSETSENLNLSHSTAERTSYRFLWTLCCLFLGLLMSCPLARSQSNESVTPSEDAAGSSDALLSGKVEGPYSLQSAIYPGTQRQYWLYVPAQYTADKPACCIVVQDGLGLAEQWQLPKTLDSLIHSKEIPVMIGIFVSPGVVPAARPDAQPRFNRSFEYDSLGDTYARFLLQELLPDVATRYNISNDPNDRAIAGASSGGICAFNVAWQRPEAFRRVLSTIGTFVGLRGGHEFPMLIRKTEPKPIRVFLQDGSQDLNIYAGNWWIANQDVLSALQWAGYEVRHAWTEGGGHDSKQAATVIPDALRWLWSGYPSTVTVGDITAGDRRVDVLIPGADWQQISSGHEAVEAITCNASGVIFFSDSKAGRIYRMGDDNRTRVFKDISARVSSMRFGPDEKLYVCKDNKKITRLDNEGNEEVVIDEQRCNRLVTLPQGFYFSDDAQNKLYWSTYKGQFQEVLSLQSRPISLMPTPDQASLNLIVADQPSTWHCMINQDFTLSHLQRFGHLHLPYLESSSGATAMVVDDQGRTYVASTLGIQVLDPLGRVNLILNKPSYAPIAGLVIGGPLRDMLYVSDGQNVYARKLKIKGVDSYTAPISLPKPRL